ncbi:MAG: transposase [Vicingaceae bacterium]|nr:transposase [Vicingaceae bacterium]
METEKFYHIYNHANRNENLFREEENYRFFLQQWDKYISPIAVTRTYCLMPNHIHFLIKIRSVEEVRMKFGFEDVKPFGKFQTFQKLVSKQFSNLYSSYAQAFNTRYQRKGSLFTPNFKRKEITSEEYLKTLVCYIHRNPIHHGFCADFTDWKHSSYHAYLSDKPSKIERTYILDLFDGKENFIETHQQYIELLDLEIFLE